MTLTTESADPRRWKVLVLITLAELLAMSVWFSAAAVTPALVRQWHLSLSAVPWLTASVQLGFVGGALFSATVGWADRVPLRRLMVLGTLGAAVSTVALLAFPAGGIAPFILRVVTGACLAVVYPVAVQWIAQWFPRQRGLAVGILIGGLTIGSALPHVMTGLPLAHHWQTILAGSAGLATIGGVLVLWAVPERASAVHPPAFRWNRIRLVMHDRPVMLANVGYWGHMWELYAMWTWLPAFLLASEAPFWHGSALIGVISGVSFLAIGAAGFVGALAGGWAADRWGRTHATIMAMTISGSMAVLIGLTYRGSPAWTFLVAIIWGISVIADSAQFSTAVTELSASDLVGSALTIQMAVGFLLTIGSIDLVGWLGPRWGWNHVMMLLAAGPLVGSIAMARLRHRPEAAQLAQGRR